MSESEVADEKPPAPVYCVEVLHVIREAQLKHGLRHDDFLRYSQYLSRRLRRIRRGVKFTNMAKSHRYKEQIVTPEIVREIRFIHVPLLLAERCWASAMALKNEARSEPRKAFHAVSKLKKAVSYAVALQTLCEGDLVDARTKLETAAYLAYLRGLLHFQVQNWPTAKDQFTAAKTIYTKLAGTLSGEMKALYEARVGDLEPYLRYCEYNAGDEGALTDLVELRMTLGDGDSSQLDELIAQTRTKQSQQMSEVTWLGRSVPVKNSRVRSFFVGLSQFREKLGETEESQHLSMYDAHVKDCHEALSALRDDLKGDNMWRSLQAGEVLDGPVSDLIYLNSYLTHLRLHAATERSLLTAAKLRRAQEEAGVAMDDTRQKPQDIVRLYDICIQNVSEMGDLPGVPTSQQEHSAARLPLLRAQRSFYLARGYQLLRSWPESTALYNLSRQYANTAAHDLRKLGEKSFDAEIERLLVMIEADKDACRAASLITSLTTEDFTIGADIKKPVNERLDTYMEEPNLQLSSVNLTKLPPDFKPMPVKPIFFDLAMNHIDYPPLDLEQKTAKPGGLLAGVTGWLWNK